MRVVVVGAGAIGGYVGCHLALAGQEVTFAVRPAAVNALREGGLRLMTPGESEPREVGPLRVAGSLAEALGGGAADCVVLAIKSFDTAAFLADLRAVTSNPPPIVCLQNGVDNEAEIAAAFGPQAVIAGTVTSPVSKSAQGVIVVEKARGMGIAMEHPLAAEFADAANAAGLKTRGYAAAGPMKWSKLLTNLLGNAASAILDLPVGALLADRHAFALEAAAQRECRRVMGAYGFGVVDLPGVPVRALAWAFNSLPAGAARLLLARLVGAGRGGKMPSLHGDVQAGRPQTEVGWLNGAVARHAAALGLRAPVNEELAAIVGSISAGRLARDHFAGQPEALWRHLRAAEARASQPRRRDSV